MRARPGPMAAYAMKEFLCFSIFENAVGHMVNLGCLGTRIGSICVKCHPIQPRCQVPNHVTTYYTTIHTSTQIQGSDTPASLTKVRVPVVWALDV